VFTFAEGGEKKEREENETGEKQMAIIRRNDFRDDRGYSGGGFYRQDPYRAGQQETDEEIGCWTPAADILEESEGIRMFLELPGVPKDDIRISVDNGVLTVTGERKAPGNEETAKQLRLERCYGWFSRSFSVSNRIDSDRIGASYENGMLILLLPYREDSKPKEIKINAE